MKTKSISLSLLAAVLLAGFSAAPAMAQGTNTPSINHAQEEIHARIQQGIASGRITRAEAQRLHQRERDFQRREARFKSDGVVTRAERQQLRKDLDALERDVDRMLHNERRADRHW